MVSFRQFLTILQGRRWEVIGVWLALMLFVGIATMLLPKRYTATSDLVVDVKAPELFSSANSLNAAWVPSYVAMQVDVLMSELVARKAIDALGLDRDPEWREAWLEQTGGQGDLHAWLAARLRKNLEVKPSLQSNAIYVAYTGASPQVAAAVTNAIVRGYISATVEMRARPTRQFTDFFDGRAKKLREELEEAQARLSAYERAHGILAKEGRLDAETARLNELNLQLISLQAQVAESASRREVALADPTHSPEVLGNAMVAGLTADLNRHRARLQELTTRLGDEHPQVLETKASVAELQRRIAAVSAQVSSSVASTEAVNRGRLARLESSLAEQRAKVMQLKEVRDKVEVLSRDVESAQKAYDMVVTRASQTDLESQNTQTNVMVIKYATEPVKPSSPLLGLNLAVAFVVGLMVAAGIAVLREIMDRRVRTREDIVADLQVVMLGELVDTDVRTALRRLPTLRPGAALPNG